MEEETVRIYERSAAIYGARRPPVHKERARTLAAAALPGLPIGDLGSGPGGYADALSCAGHDVVALDAAIAMLGLARSPHPVAADLEALPFRRHALGAGWARNTYLHVAPERLPLALADLHRALAVGAPVTISMAQGEGVGVSHELWEDDDLPGRFFALWDEERVLDIAAGAGFDDLRVENGTSGALWLTGRRARTLADTVGPGMRALVVGLNPSLVAADVGVGFAGASNRFWPAALASGLCADPARSRKPWALLRHDAVGMTDLVKRATPRASEVAQVEYASGAVRVARLAAWLRPAVVVFVGLTGYRAGVDKRAIAGFQPEPFGGCPTYVLPSTSGLNATATLAALTEHLAAALAPGLGGLRG